jgi:spermidine synthase
VFGVTVYAVSTVWAAFMAGLAVGSFAVGAIGDRVRHPLRWFGLTELSIGLTAFATPAVLDHLQRAYLRAYPSLSHSFGTLMAVRVAIAFAVLLIPTALMGATLPLVLKASSRNRTLREQVGVLYGTNAAGAIAGTLAAGLYLIPERGIHWSFAIAAGLNATVGLGALGLSFVAARFESTQGTRAESGATPVAITAARPALSSGRLRLLLVVFTVSGVVSLALEVVWFRVLTLFLRPTVYGFAVMLATILSGITIGSYLVIPLLGRRLWWLFLLAAVQLATAVTIVLSFRPLTYLAATSRQIAPFVSTLLPEYLAYPVAGSLLTIFPTALLMGLAFPIGLQLWTTGSDAGSADTARRVGVFYALNVAGGIVGSLTAGFLLLPHLGSRASLVLLAVVTFGSGLSLLSVSGARASARWPLGIVASATLAVAIAFAPDPFALFLADRYPRQQMVWREEGVEATVAVHQRGSELSLTVNGNHEASTGGPMTYVHRRIGHLPMVIHPAAQRALVIGLGGGVTASAVSMHSGVQVDVVELAGSVVRGARFFDRINHDVLNRPNVHVRVDDGRNYLMLTPDHYDVVTADVIHPIFAGAGNLYSVEYFRLICRVLKPGGLVLQWLAGTDAEYKMIARTFLSVFPHTTVWADGSLLVGSVEPLRLRRGDFDSKLKDAGRAEALRELGIDSFDKLLSMFVAGPDELGAFVGDGPLLTDDRPQAEYFLSLPRTTPTDLSRLRGDVARFVINE